MKVKIFTEGGNEIGLGHISRCSSLYDEVKSRGIDVEFIINGSIEHLDVFKELPARFENWLSTGYLDCCIGSTDYCIVDSYLANNELYELISLKAKKALYIDDFARIRYPLGIVVNPALYADNICYPIGDDNTYLLGSEYIILRRPFIHVNRSTLKEEVNEVLVTMGGSDIRYLTLRVMNQICIKYPNIKFNVVVSDCFQNIHSINQNEFSNIQLFYNVNAELMKSLMVQSDFAITAAGQTIYELLATKTPFIPIKIAENQSNNIEGLKKITINDVFINYNDVNVMEKLEKEFVKLLDYGERIRLATLYKNRVDGLGSKRIINSLLGVSSGE